MLQIEYQSRLTEPGVLSVPIGFGTANNPPAVFGILGLETQCTCVTIILQIGLDLYFDVIDYVRIL